MSAHKRDRNAEMRLARMLKKPGLICAFCHQPIDHTLNYPHPQSFSLDHIIPLSKGGTNTRDNVRGLHLVCNKTRGNRPDDHSTLKAIADSKRPKRVQGAIDITQLRVEHSGSVALPNCGCTGCMRAGDTRYRRGGPRRG